MLEEYKNIQPIAYKMLYNAGLKGRFSHAYLFESNGYINKEEMALAFAKYLLCPKHHYKIGSDNNCKYCTRIASGNFPEIKIINPDGLWIKKDQLSDLQKEFSKKAVESDKKVYVINNAECLNDQAANSILKFLEEPEDNIVAILITDNIYQIIETIRSRCQLIPFAKIATDTKLSDDEQTLMNIKNILNNNRQTKEFNNEKIVEILNKVTNFINYYEENKKDTHLYLQKIWNNYFVDKDLLLVGFEIMTLYYKDILNSLLNAEVETFINCKENIKIIAEKNNVNDICDKLKAILKLKEKIKTNINNNLLMDKLIIMFEGGTNNV